MHIYTDDPLISPVSSDELVDWARLDSDDPMIDGALIAATSAVIAFLKLDLINRTWTLIHEDWPITGTMSCPSISRQTYSPKRRIELPYANLVSITEVLLNGEEETEYRVIKGKPYRIQLDSLGYTTSDSDALEVTYVAGYGVSANDVPAPIKQAILMTATYIISHNGECDAGNAISMSGAKPLLVPYAVRAGITI